MVYTVSASGATGIDRAEEGMGAWRRGTGGGKDTVLKGEDMATDTAGGGGGNIVGGCERTAGE